ncbi:peptidoglycan/LPS O-acetylase OafA/YrhL [Rhodococcus sp. 27YEA15]
MTIPVGTTGSSRLDSLTGLRFCAAPAVFVCHAYLVATMTGTRTLPEWATAAGFAGVGFFFVLSGFVLTWSAKKNDSDLGFWRRRFVKIYPNHFVTWAIAIVLAVWAGEAITTGQLVP